MASDPKPEFYAVARVVVTVEVEAGSWGEDCSVSQIMKQAGEEAQNKVRRLVGNAGRVLDAKVTAIFGDRTQERKP